MSYRSYLVPAIQWHEGMLLSPQHFQQQELRNFQVLSYHLRHLMPYHWGVHLIKFDPIPLPTGLLRLLEVEAIMPDGLIVQYIAEAGGAHIEVDVTAQKQVLQKEAMTLFLCVPEYTPDSSPVIGEWPRFSSIEGDPVEDENVTDNSIHIPRLIPKLKLILADKAPQRYVSLPVAKVQYKDDVYTFARYEPPCFWVNQLSLVGELCGALVRRLRDKAVYFSDKWQSQIGTPLITETSNQLRPLVTCLPLLEGMLASNQVHPFHLYQSLCMVAGQLATLRLGQIPPVFPIYDHKNIYASYTPLLEWCNLLLDSLEKAYSILEFTHTDRMFSIMLHHEIFAPKILVGLKAPSTMTEGELADWMNDAIVASESYVEMARIRRITGVVRTLEEDRALLDLMPGRGVLIFRLDLDPQFVKPGERLLIFNPADTAEHRPTQIVLYLKNDILKPAIPEQEYQIGLG
jgi:type VI secretion system protein ImpJ